MSIKISALPTVTGLSGSDVFPVNASGTTSKISLTNLETVLGYQPLTANLTTLGAITPGDPGKAFLAIASPLAASYVKVSTSGVISFFSVAGVRSDIQAQPLNSVLTDLSTLAAATQVGKNLLTLPNLSGPKYIWCDGVSGASGQNITPKTSAQVAADVRPYLLPPATQKATTGTTITPNLDLAGSGKDFYAFTALATGLTINAPTSPPTDGGLLTFRIKDDGTTRTLTWNAVYRGGTVALITATSNKTNYLQFMYNVDDTKWDLILAQAI